MTNKVKAKLRSFFSKYKYHRYKKGEVLIRAEDVPTGVYLLKTGIIKQFCITCSGDDLTLNIYKPFSFFPTDWAINNNLSNHYFEAMTAVEVWRAPKEDFIKLIKNDPEVLFDLVRRMNLGIEGLLMRLEYLMSGDAYSRLITELLIYAKRFGERKGKGVLIKLKLTQKDIAAQSGIARETVSREMHELKRRSLIKYNNKQLLIKNINTFQNELFRN